MTSTYDHRHLSGTLGYSPNTNLLFGRIGDTTKTILNKAFIFFCSGVLNECEQESKVRGNTTGMPVSTSMNSET
ncbi:uncharacterized protein N7500_006676 [Penicillium coprophilum]|uniref:uncharacterized protein n=1 Tax=Penicillium coprophilum TaxID=36646 RepID=UPI002389F16A|nr:uncharacterized protein N7500_006676 [Penicillium coprophilum]KAJ5164846.1 hypothetical protein N7500_006676 [Penicillium coprophilum]